MKNTFKLKLGIYLCGMLMMGAIGVSGALATIGAHFSQYSQTMITNIAAIPALVVIPVTLIAGKLMDKISKKTLMIAGIIFIIVGGIAPALMTNFFVILALRGLLGVGLGVVQVVSPALVADNFEGHEQEVVQGRMTSFQMVGCTIMAVGGGLLGDIRWNISFLVYSLAFISLVAAIALLPNDKKHVAKAAAGDAKSKSESSKMQDMKGVIFCLVMVFLFFVVCQSFSNCVSFLITAKNIGTATQGGNSIAVFSIGGILMGFVYGKLAKVLKNAVIAVGFLLLAVSYVVLAVAPNMLVIYIGSAIVGFAVASELPSLFVAIADAAGPAAAGMALAVLTCIQSLSQFLCPYIMGAIGNVLAGITGGESNELMLYAGAAIVGVIGIVTLIKFTAKKNA